MIFDDDAWYNDELDDETNDGIDPETQRELQLIDKVEEAFKAGKQLYLDTEDIDELFSYYCLRKEFEYAAYLLSLGEQYHKDDELIQILRPILLYQQDKNEEALRMIDALDLQHNPNWHYNRAKILTALGRIDEAEKEGEYIIEQDKSNSALYTRDIINIFLPEYPEAAKQILLSALLYNPQHFDIIMQIAFIYSEEGDTEKALYYFDQAIDIEPYSILAWIEKCKLHAISQRYEEALDAVEYALAIEPNHQHASLIKAHLLIDLEKYEEAGEYIAEKAEELPALYYDFQALQADILYLQKDYSTAAKIYKECLANDNCPIDSMIHYVDIKIEQHRWKEALDICKTLLSSYPDNVSLLEHTAQVYEKTGCKHVAVKYLRKCIRLMPDNPNLLLLYAGLMLDMDNVQNGIRYVRKAYKIAPTEALPNIMMAVVNAQFYNGKDITRYLDVARQEDENAVNIFLNICPRGGRYLFPDKDKDK